MNDSTLPTTSVDTPSIEDRLFANKYTDHDESHLDVEVEDTCLDCQTYDCVSVCPANVWRNVQDPDGVPMIAYENCLECGSCRWACPYDNVVWEYPPNGSGMTYKYG